MLKNKTSVHFCSPPTPQRFPLYCPSGYEIMVNTKKIVISYFTYFTWISSTSGDFLAGLFLLFLGNTGCWNFSSRNDRTDRTLWSWEQNNGGVESQNNLRKFISNGGWQTAFNPVPYCTQPISNYLASLGCRMV